MKRSKKIVVSAATLSLLLFTPLHLIHAQSIVFSKDAQGDWEFNSGFQSNGTFHALVTSDGRGSFGGGSNFTDTSIPESVDIEVLVANTGGAGFSSPCSTPKFTGNPTVDLACYATAATNQGFPYTIGQTAKVAAPAKSAPCKCP
jgi:hypothetical protein